ncbi:hypothetical protein JTB14_014221 [Gonioctena quinquepunctata]|nr:hypothetical protein JTB14_014221 [Gonioctena quinquepunctata]
MVTEFNLQESTQNQYDPFFTCTKSMDDNQGLFDCPTIPNFSISSSSMSICCCITGFNQLYLYLIRALSVWITCCALFVHPKSLPINHTLGSTTACMTFSEVFGHSNAPLNLPGLLRPKRFSYHDVKMSENSDSGMTRVSMSHTLA